MSDSWCVGMDGGGTRTRAVLVDEAGRVEARAVAGPGNYQLVGLEGVAELVGGLLASLWAQGGGPRQPASLCVALAGAGRAAEQEALGARLAELDGAAQVRVVSDARAALEGAHPGSDGLIVIAGTGSMVLGKTAVGPEMRAGGLGPILGDEGSGYRLVLESVRAVLRARDGAGPATALTGGLAEEFGVGQWEEVIPRVYGGDLTRDRIAAAAPRVFAAVRRGDEVAARVLGREYGALGHQVAAVASRLGLNPAAVACLGGVFAEIEMVWPHLARAAAGRGVEVTRVQARLEPALGAALLARQAAGPPLPAGFVAGLERSGPGAWDEIGGARCDGSV